MDLCLTDGLSMLLQLHELGLRKLQMFLVFAVGGAPGVRACVGPAQGSRRKLLTLIKTIL